MSAGETMGFPNPCLVAAPDGAGDVLCGVHGNVQDLLPNHGLVEPWYPHQVQAASEARSRPARALDARKAKKVCSLDKPAEHQLRQEPRLATGINMRSQACQNNISCVKRPPLLVATLVPVRTKHVVADRAVTST